MRKGAIAIVVSVLFATGCEDKPRAVTGPPGNRSPVSVRIDGPAQITSPAEAQFTAVQTLSDGSTRDVTASAQWTSSNPSVLSVNAGLAKGLAGGEVGLTVQVAQLTSQPKSVRVVPSVPEWSGTYTLSIGSASCNGTRPISEELRQRTYTATIRQIPLSLSLEGVVTNVGSFGGQILNPQVRFSFPKSVFSRHIQRIAARGPAGRMQLVNYRRSAYDSGPSGFFEILPNGDRLFIDGVATTTMSPSGFVGTLDGALTQLARNFVVVGICPSSSHGFSLVRQ